MNPLALALVFAVAAPAFAGTTPDPVKEASDWQAVIHASSRTGGLKDQNACGACVGNLDNLPACHVVPVNDLMQTKKPAQACVDSCSVETAVEYDKIVERMRAEPKCRAEMTDPAAIKRASENAGEELAPALHQCNACVTPADSAKWPERRKALFQLHARLGEALGKTDAASRAAALAPLFGEAKLQFVCADGKIDPAFCLLKR